MSDGSWFYLMEQSPKNGNVWQAEVDYERTCWRVGIGLPSGCDLGGYEEEDPQDETGSEPGKGQHESWIWKIGVADIVCERKQAASEEEEEGLKRGWTWPREGE